MAGRVEDVTPRRELVSKLVSRQARSEIDGAVFETQPASPSSDMVWNTITPSQFTPRHEDLCLPPRGREEAPDRTQQAAASSSSGAATTTAAASSGDRQRSVSPRSPPSLPSERTGGLRPDGDRAEEELSATVSELRENVERERERSRQLEKRAAEAEFIAVWLKEELDKSMGAVDLEGTRPLVHRQGGAEDVEMDSTQPVVRRATGEAGTSAAEGSPPTRPQLGLGGPTPTQPKMGIGTQPASLATEPKLGGLSPWQPEGGPPPKNVQELPMVRMPSYDEGLVDISAIQDPRQLREELRRSHQYIEEKQHEVICLEEQNLVLQEELNLEKQKVIELKRAANAQKEESQKASGELEMNQWLQEEVALLRSEAKKMQERLEQAAQREHFLKAEVSDLRSAAGQASNLHSEEMGRLSVTVGEQLLQVEHELAQRTKELSEAIEPFLKHAHGLLGTVRKACVQIEGATGRQRQAPPLYDLRSRDMASSFRIILKLLKYAVEVLAQHTGMVNVFQQGDACSATETAGSLVSSVQDAGMSGRPSIKDVYSTSGSQNRGLRAPSDAELRRPADQDLGPPQDPSVDVVRESSFKRWMCYLQE